jgi:ABC-type lipoprotein release transport system permease subunit
MALAGLGVVIGILGALLLSRVMESMLFGTNARDALTFIGVPLILIAVAFTATLVPARRATVVDPVQALKCE